MSQVTMSQCHNRINIKQGASKQEDIKTVRKSRSYRTSGEKQQSIVAHIAVAADTKDPAYGIYRDFREITSVLKRERGFRQGRSYD